MGIIFTLNVATRIVRLIPMAILAIFMTKEAIEVLLKEKGDKGGSP